MILVLPAEQVPCYIWQQLGYYDLLFSSEPEPITKGFWVFPQKKANFSNRSVFSVPVFANNRDRELILLVTLYCLVLLLQFQYFDVCFASTAILYRGCCCFTFPQLSQWNLFNDEVLFCITSTSLKNIIAVDLLGLFLYPSAGIY